MKKPKLLSIFVWPLATIMLYGIMRGVLYTKVAIPLWRYIGLTEGAWLDVSVSIAIIGCLFWGWISKRKCYSPRHLGITLSIIVLVLVFYVDNTSTPYLNYFGIIPCWIAILCAFLTGFVAHYLFNFIARYFKKPKENSTLPIVRLFQDRPVSILDEDGLSYKDLAQRVTSSIINNNWDESFSIGITGSWGAGKTSMLQFIKNYFKKLEDVIVIEFSPRQSATVHDIQKDFLSQLAESLSKYHSGAFRVTQKYIQSLRTLPDNLWAGRLLGSISDLDISQRREELKEVVKEIGKKIVVLVDDFDRLSGEEIQEVLKLIDKNAAFPKTFFVTAYDKAQTNKAIAKYLGHDTAKDKIDYTDKYFNVEVSLPIRRLINYVRVLKENFYALVDNGDIKCTKDDIDNALTRLFPFVTTYLPTIRDAKRYSNLVSITLPQVEKDVLLGDYLLLSLIRYRYPEEYYNLGRHTYLIRFDTTIPKKNHLELNQARIRDVSSINVLKVLFNGKDAPYKAIAHVNSFTNYFYDLDSGHLLYKDLSVFLNPEITPEEFKTKVESIVKNESQQLDFVEFVLSQESNIHSNEDLMKYLRLYMLARTYCKSRNFYVATISYLLKDNVKEYLKKFNIADEDTYKVILKAALAEKFEYWLSIECLHDALHAVTMLDSGEIPELIISYDELKAFALNKLEKAISSISEGVIAPDDIYRTLRACVCEYIPEPGPGESIMTEAIKMVKDAMLKYPDFFFKEFLYHRNDPEKSSTIQFYIDEDKIPYKDLFKGIEEFDAYISEIIKEKGTSSMLLCMSQFADYGTTQKTWTPSISIKGDFGSIMQHDYQMYNKLFEGEPTYA